MVMDCGAENIQYRKMPIGGISVGYRIENVTVITWDEEIKVIKNATVKTDGSIISYVGNKENNNLQATSDIILDGTGKALIPGLVNAHTHIPMTLLRSYADDLDLQTWLFEHIFKVEEIGRASCRERV